MRKNATTSVLSSKESTKPSQSSLLCVNSEVGGEEPSEEEAHKTRAAKSTARSSKSQAGQKILFYVPDAYATTAHSNKAREVAVAAKVAMSMSLVMSDMNISHVGDAQMLEALCGMHVLELDISKNAFGDWNEVVLLFFIS